MATYAIVKTGGKQYIVKPNDEIVVDKIEGNAGDKVEVTSLATFTDEGKVTLGAPKLDKAVSAEILETAKGTKIRVAKFKSKVRYRNVRGFRATLTKLKILSI